MLVVGEASMVFAWFAKAAWGPTDLCGLAWMTHATHNFLQGVFVKTNFKAPRWQNGVTASS